MSRFRLPRFPVRLAVLAGIGLLGWWFVGGRRHGRLPDPVHRGRHASVWFEELVRTAGALGREDELLRHLEARRMLMQLGTQAVPVLVDAAVRPVSDGPLRRGLREVLEEVGSGFFRPGSFAPPDRRVAQAEALVQAIRPPANQVGRILGPHLEPGGVEHWRALTVLSRTADAGPEMWSRLRDLLAKPATASSAAYLLADAAPLPAEVVAWVESAEPVGPERFGWERLVGVVGPELRSAPAWLERTLGDARASDLDRLGAAVVLLELRPGHRPAGDFLNGVVDGAGFTPWNHLTNAAAKTFCDLTRELWPGPIRSPVTIGALERLARRQVEGWNERGLADSVGLALERIAPGRAARLYEEQLLSTNRDNLRIVAAGSLLRVERTNEVAARFLLDHARRDGHLERMAIEQLAELDARCTWAMIELERISREQSDPGAHPKARVSLEQIELRTFEERAKVGR